MSLMLDLVYSVAVGLVAVVGVVLVLFGTGEGTGKGGTLANAALAGLTVLFVGALVWTMAVDPLI